MNDPTWVRIRPPFVGATGAWPAHWETTKLIAKMTSWQRRPIRRDVLLRIGRASASLFLAIVVLQRLGTEQPAFGQAHAPFLADRIIERLTNQIVGHDVKDQIFRAVIDQLVRLAGFEDEGVAPFDGCRSLGVPDKAFA